MFKVLLRCVLTETVQACAESDTVAFCALFTHKTGVIICQFINRPIVLMRIFSGLTDAVIVALSY